MNGLLPRRDFAELSRRVKEHADRQGWLQAHGCELAVFAARALLFLGGYWLCAAGGGLVFASGLAVMSYAYYGIAITGVHESSHRAFAASTDANRLWLRFFSDFWSAQSGEWWHERHVILHHVHTNVVDRDPPLFIYPWLDKRLYFFVTPFLVSFWLVWNSAAYLRAKGRGLSLYLLLAAAGWAFHIALFARLMPLPGAVLAAFVMRSLFAPVFMHLAVFNHIGLEFPRARREWLPHQTRTTRNLKPHWFLSGMGGNAFVECHLEHHLFPALSNRLLASVRPMVREALEKAGYAYVEQGYWACLDESLAHYDDFFTDAAAAP
ncbi:MAG TPA: fatty acid desaturase [Elusimicrobiota bacterium]|nr:fatty acid desaturase [Elusimicrobiota bacterium]